MSVTIDLPNEVYERLEKQAQARGTTTAEAVARLIEEIEATHLSAVVKQMEMEGLFADIPESIPSMPIDFQPIQVQGKPLSTVIVEDRV